MVLIRQSFAVVTIGAVKPAPEKQRTTRTALAVWESRPGQQVGPGLPVTPGLACG
jgi:hypothetical protein